MIKSAASVAFPKNMGASHQPAVRAELLSVASPAFGHWGGCASSRLDHTVDLQAPPASFGSRNGSRSTSQLHWSR